MERDIPVRDVHPVRTFPVCRNCFSYYGLHGSSVLNLIKMAGIAFLGGLHGVA